MKAGEHERKKASLCVELRRGVFGSGGVAAAQEEREREPT